MALDGGLVLTLIADGLGALINFVSQLEEKDRQKIYDQMRAQKTANAAATQELIAVVQAAVEARDANRKAMAEAATVIVPPPPAPTPAAVPEEVAGPILAADDIIDALKTSGTEDRAHILKWLTENP